VWHANGLQGTCVLKVAWRDENRMNESDIYGAIGFGPPSVAKFLAGGDVLFPAAMTSKAVKVTVRHIRSDLGIGGNDGTHLFHNRVLHRDPSVDHYGSTILRKNCSKVFLQW
jgi:hypothetical protein